MITPGEKWFSGVVVNVHDAAQYFSWIREAGQGILTENKLTSEPSNTVFFNLHWWLAGRVAALFGFSMSQIYQIYRVLAVILLIAIIYAFSALIFKHQAKRRFVFLLSILTSGLGWIWVVRQQFTGQLDFPLDVHISLGNTFYTMMASPHLSFAAALTLLVLLLTLIGLQRRNYGISLAAGFIALFLGMGHVYDLVTIWAVLGVFGILITLRDGWSWRNSWAIILVILISAPSAVYWGWVSSSANPVWQQALKQFDNLGVFTPSPPHLVILLGLAFLVALVTFGGVLPLGRQSTAMLLIKVWFGVTLVLIYLPLPFQIMLLTGYQFPMAVLATNGIFDHMLPWLRARIPCDRYGRLIRGDQIGQWLPAFFLVCVMLTNFYLLGWRLVVLGRHDYPYFLFMDDLAGFKWLEDESDPDEVVLSSFVIGHFLPGLAGNRAFLSNAVMTMDFHHKRELVEAFFDPATSDFDRQAAMREFGIDYIFHGEAERAIGSYDPEESPIFRQVFSSPRVKIYEPKVSKNADGAFP